MIFAAFVNGSFVQYWTKTRRDSMSNFGDTLDFKIVTTLPLGMQCNGFESIASVSRSYGMKNESISKIHKEANLA